ncbi:hypothetical protein SAMN05421829_108171 [Aromatoleum tolulyticum]|uniref:Uncharacterized protein n=1 Tax=Aromatoleum tolulyticum TaxID=34027 RepID=A0A1N6X353_9RHOO|nr:hypothetical protein [Aromatoleum tolulyticum]SIQ96700.1 hypothetical protein SAMN05421829_108171 [Aromatoleum tolulyticum]
MSGKILRRLVVTDAVAGGRGFLEGTTKVVGTPDAPVSRRVHLIMQISARAELAFPGRIARSAWSDPVTGAWRFDYINAAAKFAVLAYDHTGVNDPAAKVGLIPTPMPDVI